MNFEVIENELDGNKPIHNFMYLTFPNESKEQLLKLISKCIYIYIYIYILNRRGGYKRIEGIEGTYARSKEGEREE